MKRHAVALLLQPYKNRLMAVSELKGSANNFAERLLDLSGKYPNFHFNVVLPGYILECINPLLLSKLREMHKRGCLEWLLTGYTEPFLHFSPMALTEKNIRHGFEVFSELTGAVPSGFLPPFSSWEPSCIAMLRTFGVNYAVLSSEAFPDAMRSACGYWSTDQGGDALALFPSKLLHRFSAPADIIEWLDGLIAQDRHDIGSDKIVTVHYLLPLQPEKGLDAYQWLKSAIGEIDKHLLSFRAVLLQEAHSLQKPIGLQHLPSCLPFFDGESEQHDAEPHYFLNRLRSFDQVGILQRKMMDITDRVNAIKERRLSDRLLKSLFFLQDINRYLPGKVSGFTVLADRMWTYARLIDLEAELREHDEVTGGRIRITDFLRNGNKSIIMSNDRLRVYCDYKNGGHLYELDYSDRGINLASAFNPLPHSPPDIVSPGKSFSSFIDRIYGEATTPEEIISGAAADTGTFADGVFEYKIKKTPGGVKAALNRQGGFQSGGKNLPLSMEKVFGVEKNDATLSFVYQLANHSLSTYSFIFAVELYFALPGIPDRYVRLISGKTVYTDIGWKPLVLDKATKWSISDFGAGVRLQFTTQKPLDVYCLPLAGSDGRTDPACGFKLVLTAPVTLEQSSSWSLVGSMGCAKLRKRQKEDDAL